MSSRKAEVGEAVSWADLVEDQDRVLPPCDSQGGHWACLVHKETHRHNMAATLHESDPGDHVSAWFCPEHGIEAS